MWLLLLVVGIGAVWFLVDLAFGPPGPNDWML